MLKGIFYPTTESRGQPPPGIATGAGKAVDPAAVKGRAVGRFMLEGIAKSGMGQRGFLPLLAAEGGVPWSYGGAGAPNHWAELSPDYALCAAGLNQSPIDLTGYTTDPAAPPLSFAYGGNAQAVRHNGRIADVEYAPGNRIVIGDRTYELKAMHIHAPAEHQIDRELFAAELHLVHRNAAGDYAVVGQLFRLGEPDPVVQALLDAYPEPGQSRESGFALDAAALVPSDLGYYRYSGSLTTPPCAEPVDWIALREIRAIAQEQVNRIAALHNGFNHRPIQPRNGREIIYTGER